MTAGRHGVLVVDDSALMRRLVGDLVEREAGFHVVAYARDGVEALEKVEHLRPDVVVLDVEMPRLGGLETLRQIMERWPRPVLVFSALSQPGSEVAIRALELGALDVLAKPGDLRAAGGIEGLASALGARLRAAVRARIENLLEPGGLGDARDGQPLRLTPGGESRVVAIAASVGGPATLARLLARLPPGFPAPVLVVQHMPPGFTATFAARLNERLALRVREGGHGERLREGVVYVAPGGRHMRVAHGRRLELGDGEPRCGVRPSADELFESVADVYGSRAIAVILTGMGRDGTLGGRALRGAGGWVVAQDRETSVVYGMPRSAIEAGVCQEVLPLEEIADRLIELCRSPARTPVP